MVSSKATCVRLRRPNAATKTTQTATPPDHVYKTDFGSYVSHCNGSIRDTEVLRLSSRDLALPLLHLHVSVSSADVSVVLSLVLRYQKAAEESNAEKKKVRTQSACSFANPM